MISVILYVFNSIIVFKFFDISVKSSGLFCCMLRHMLRAVRCCFGCLEFFNGIFSANSNPSFIRVE